MDDNTTAPAAANATTICQAAYVPFMQRYPTCAFTALLGQGHVNATAVRATDCSSASLCRLGLNAFVAAFQPQVPSNVLAKCVLTDIPTKLTATAASLGALCLGEAPPPPPATPVAIDTLSSLAPFTSLKANATSSVGGHAMDPALTPPSSGSPKQAMTLTPSPLSLDVQATGRPNDMASIVMIVCMSLMALVIIAGVACVARKLGRRRRRVEEYSTMQDMTATEMIQLMRQRDQTTSSLTTTLDMPPPVQRPPRARFAPHTPMDFNLDGWDLPTPKQRSSQPPTPDVGSRTPKPRQSFPPPSPMPHDMEEVTATLAEHSIPAPDVHLLHPVSQGLTCEIWLAQLRKNRMVTATRLLPHKKTPYDLYVFVRAVQLLARLKCPEYIVEFVGVTGAVGRPTDTMLLTEYMDCGDLRGVLDTNHADSSFHWSHKLQCAAHIALGLTHLHAQSVVHGNLMSLNVLVDSVKGAKLSDINGGINNTEDELGTTLQFRRFGRSRGSNLKLLTAGLGAFRWVAPEVLRGDQVTPAADVYSMGVILAELDTEQMPFAISSALGGTAPGDLTPRVVTPRRQREDDDANKIVLAKIVAETLHPTFSPTCPAWYLALATTCLATDPTHRPTASAVASRFQTQLDIAPLVYDTLTHGTHVTARA